MPEYRLKCPGCKKQIIGFHKMTEPHGSCAECKTPLEVDWSDASAAPKVIGNTLVGTRRILQEFRCAKHEVGKLRRMYKDSGHCWTDDGRVIAEDKHEAEKFIRKDQEIRDSFARAKAEQAEQNQA